MIQPVFSTTTQRPGILPVAMILEKSSSLIFLYSPCMFQTAIHIQVRHPVSRRNHFTSMSTFEEQNGFNKVLLGDYTEGKDRPKISVKQHLHIVKNYMQRPKATRISTNEGLRGGNFIRRCFRNLPWDYIFIANKIEKMSKMGSCWRLWGKMDKALQTTNCPSLRCPCFYITILRKEGANK